MWKVHILKCPRGKKCTLADTKYFQSAKEADVFRLTYNANPDRVKPGLFFMAQGPYAFENTHTEKTLERA